ncbi:MAG: hypothetical protein WBB67_13745 [bacterium]
MKFGSYENRKIGKHRDLEARLWLKSLINQATTIEYETEKWHWVRE